MSETEKDIKLVTKELINVNKKVESLSVWREKINFLEMIFRDVIKAVIVSGMIFSYYKKDILMMLLFIGIAIITLGYWKEHKE